jgi:phosphotransferase system  glucose/maltose/N-acetylglucosamine-specific IIC component
MKQHLDQAELFERKYDVGEKKFWLKWISKFLFTLISVKVWGLFAGTLVSTLLVYNHYMNGAQWVTFNTTIWALIYGMKEVFRIAEGREQSERKLNAQKSQAEERMTAMQKSDSVYSEAMVTVGVNPD